MLKTMYHEVYIMHLIIKRTYNVLETSNTNLPLTENFFFVFRAHITTNFGCDVRVLQYVCFITFQILVSIVMIWP